MPGSTRFVIVIGTDGSASGRAAVEAAARFPWPARAEAVLVVATRGAIEWSPAARALAQGVAQRVGASTLRTLRRRWPAARASYPLQAPSGALLAAARSGGRGAIVVGSGGRGVLGRMLLGSVSRQVVQAAACPVLVVKGRLRRARRFTIGVDGSANSRRAAEMVARLSVPPGGRVTLVSVIEPRRVPSGGLMPARIGGALRAEAARLTAARRSEAGKGPAATGGPASTGRLEGAGGGPRRHAPGGVARRGDCQPDRCTRHRGPGHRRCRAAAAGQRRGRGHDRGTDVDPGGPLD